MNVIKLLEGWQTYYNILKNVSRQQIQAERRLTENLGNLFSDVLDGVVDRIESRDRVDVEQSRRIINEFMDDMKDDYTEILKEEATEMATAGRNKTIYHLRASGMSIDYTDLSDNIKRLIEDQILESVDYTSGRISNDLIGIIQDGVSEGLNSKEVAERLMQKKETMSQAEARRIARTEINNYANLSSFETEKEFGVEYHQWVTAEDERVRGNDPDDEADHVRLHLQIVRVGDTFENGLQFPGDRSGPIEEWINCRCAVVPFVMPVDMMAPSGQDYFYEEDLRPVA